MPKIITSPVERWSGTVTLSDPLNFPQSFAYQDCMEERNNVVEDVGYDRACYCLLPGIIGIVEKWELDGFPDNLTVDTFPATPLKASVELIDWLYIEISKLYLGDQEIPKE